MEGDSALAYAGGRFDAAHDRFVELFRAEFPDLRDGATVLELGCGHGDILGRLARALPGVTLHGVDGSTTMIEAGRSLMAELGLSDRVRFVLGSVPETTLPHESYDVVISNSVVHHVADTGAFWGFVKKVSRRGTAIFHMDLLRPPSRDAATALVSQHAGGDSPVLQRDFFNSLLAAYEFREIAQQTAEAGLAELAVRKPDDLHWMVAGRRGG